MQKQTRLYVACIVALVSVAFGFIIREFLLDDWEKLFNLSQSELGSIQGAGLFPQALTMIIFSLVVDRIGYGRVIAFAWIAHVLSAVVTLSATGYQGLYWGTLIFALANGAVEAVVNPVTATLYPNSKTQHLNILHAGWPGGLVLGGILAILIGTAGGVDAWRGKVALLLIPTTIYGLLMLGRRFPEQERVAAGVSYMDMLKEFGIAGCLIVSIFVAYAANAICADVWPSIEQGRLHPDSARADGRVCYSSPQLRASDVRFSDADHDTSGDNGVGHRQLDFKIDGARSATRCRRQRRQIRPHLHLLDHARAPLFPLGRSSVEFPRLASSPSARESPPPVYSGSPMPIPLPSSFWRRLATDAAKRSFGPPPSASSPNNSPRAAR